MLIGYARTSTTDQKAGLADQVAELRKAGCERIYEEHGSGVDAERPKLAEVVEFARAGDTILVTKPDRIARSAADLLSIVQTIRGKGANVRIMSLDLDTRSPTGKLLLVTLAGMAEFERDIMLERQRAGIAAAKAAGKYKGRAPTARRKAPEILALLDEGIGESEIARRLGISRSSVYRIIAEERPGKSGRPSALSDEEKRAVVADLAAGATVSATARKFGTTRQTILRAERKAVEGLPAATSPAPAVATPSPEAVAAAIERLKVDWSKPKDQRRPPWEIAADVDTMATAHPENAKEARKAFGLPTEG